MKHTKSTTHDTRSVFILMKKNRHGFRSNILIAIKNLGTGKTLSLLCATLGWITKQKEIKQAWISKLLEDSDDDDSQMEGEGEAGAVRGNEKDVLNGTSQTHDNSNGLPNDEVIPMEKIPQVIYASRTHSQLNQGIIA